MIGLTLDEHYTSKPTRSLSVFAYISQKYPNQPQQLISSEISKDTGSVHSGIYLRDQFVDSLDGFVSVGSLDDNKQVYIMEDVSTDEIIPPLPVLQYQDYIRECQDIQRSIIIRNKEKNISRSNSIDEKQEDDNAAEWLQLAGLSELITDPAFSQPGKLVPRDSLSSMTVLLTLTRPQREAVLRRITSFNRKQKNKPSKPALSAVFPNIDISPTSEKDVKQKCDAASETPSPVSDLLTNDTSVIKSVHSTPTCQSGVSEQSFQLVEGSVKSLTLCESEVSQDEAEKSREQAASSESLPSTTMPSIKPGFDIYPSASTTTPRRRDGYINSLRNTVWASLPNLNERQSFCTANRKTSACNSQLGEKCTSVSLSELKVDHTSDITSPGFRYRSNTNELDGKSKGLNDLPPKMSEPSNVDARLLLRAEKKENKFSKFRRSLRVSRKSPSKKENNFSNSKKQEVPPDIPQHVKNSTAKSPNLKKRLLPASTGFSIPSRRNTLSASPVKVHSSLDIPISNNSFDVQKDSHRKHPYSPKLSSMSFSAMRSGYKRTGSYKYKQGLTSPRKSLRRSRSLKTRDKSFVNVHSITKQPTSPQTVKKLISKSPSIDTLSISSKSDTSSWKSSKEEVSTEDSGYVEKQKCISFSADVSIQDTLPDYSLVSDRLGITKISDLSALDMSKVQSLALIELTSLFDLREIELKRRKPGKFKIKDHSVFGTPLNTLVEWDRRREKSDQFVPLVFEQIILFLEKRSLKVEGILRKSGSAARIKALKQDIDLRYGLSPPSNLALVSSSKAWTDAHPNDVAALLKQFLRELPDPLLTSEYINAFQSCSFLMDRKEQLQALNLLIILLDEVHRDSLKLLLKFLSRVVANEHYNKMSLNNVAMIVAPNLFIHSRKGKKEATVTQDLKVAAGTSNIVRMLIKYHKLLWTIPAFMLTQVRSINKAEIESKKRSKDKMKLKFFSSYKKDSAGTISFLQKITQPFDYETPKNLIRVQAPNMNLTSIAVQLTDQLTASDVITKYRRQCERMHQTEKDQRDAISNENYALYEVGGNITSRCLDPNTNVNAVLRVNPDVIWYIKRKTQH